MEPRIQYAKTEDGVSIAFYTLGEGMPIVEMVTPTSIQYDWQILEMRRVFERTAEKRKLVRFDARGFGLSDHDADDYSLNAQVLDLEAVVNRLDLGRLALVGSGFLGPLAISYAAQHPEQVSHLILRNSYARASDVMAKPQAQGLVALLDKDWELFTETFAHVALGWSAGEPAQRYAVLMRESMTPEYLRKYIVAHGNVDVTDLLPRVRCPTLVLYSRQLQVYGSEVAKSLASRIPDAHLVPLELVSPLASPDDMKTLATTIDEFLGEGEEAAGRAEPPETGAFRTILFTDVEGSTALTDRLGDARARELLREHERTVREALKAHGGSEIKALGDGFMTSFSSATKALECAIAMQRAFAEHSESAQEPILVRIGLNAGEPIAEDDDLFGTAVNEAARITATAKGGEILASDVVRQLVKGKDFLFSDVGERQLKGLDEPVRLFEVMWEPETT